MHMISRGLGAPVILSREDGEGPVDSMRGTWCTGPSASARLRMTGVRVATMLLLALPLAAATTVDRIAAVIDRQVITVSEVTQMVALRFFPRAPGASEDDHRHSVLEALIAQALRFRDVERFGAEDVPKDSIESRVQEIVKRFPTPADFDAAL